MDLFLTATTQPVLAIQISTILLIAGAICAVIAIISLVMKKRPSNALDSAAEASEGMDCAAIAAAILAAVGGKGNISGVDCCTTRLRLEIRDYTAVNEKAVKAAGASGVSLNKNSCQITFGPHAQAQPVRVELEKLL